MVRAVRQVGARRMSWPTAVDPKLPAGGAQLGGRGLGAVGTQAEHDRADLAAADPALEVQGAGECLARVGQRVDVRQHRPGVDEDGVAAERHDNRDAGLFQSLPEVLHRPDPVAQVVVVDGPSLGPFSRGSSSDGLPSGVNISARRVVVMAATIGDAHGPSATN
jgi:hypothetical protein